MAEIGKFEKNRSAWLNLKGFGESIFCHAKRIFLWPGRIQRRPPLKKGGNKGWKKKPKI
jgi:hypothetical protein